jgi:hypothetical protein
MMLGWIGNFIIIAAIILLGRKMRFGWVLSIIGNLLWCIYAIQIENAPAFFIDGLTLCLAVYNWLIWKRYA